MFADGHLLLFLRSDNGIQTCCPETKESDVLVESSKNYGLRGFTYAHAGDEGGAIVAYSSSQILIFPWNSSSNAALLKPIRTIDLGTQECKIPASNTTVPNDIAVDWVTNVAYITYAGCPRIRAYDLKSSLYATLYESLDPRFGTDLIVAVPPEGYEIAAVYLYCIKK